MPPQPGSQDVELRVVATVSGMMQADILKAKLQEAGIPAILEYESAGPVIGITVGGLRLSQVRILVADQDAQDAERILTTPPPPGWEQEATTSTADP